MYTVYFRAHIHNASYISGYMNIVNIAYYIMNIIHFVMVNVYPYAYNSNYIEMQLAYGI